MSAAFVKQVQQFSLSDGSLTNVITLTAGIAAGDFAVVYWEGGVDNVNVLASVADSKNSSNWTVLTPSNDAGSTSYSCGIAYAPITTALLVGDTISLTWTNTNIASKSGSIFEYSGIATTTPLDAQAVTNDTFTGGAVSVPVTSSVSGDLIVAIIGQLHAQTYTVGGGFTNGANNTDVNGRRSDYLYLIAGAAGSYNPAGSLGSADNYRGKIAAFKAAAGGGTNVSITAASGRVLVQAPVPASLFASGLFVPPPATVLVSARAPSVVATSPGSSASITAVPGRALVGARAPSLSLALTAVTGRTLVGARAPLLSLVNPVSASVTAVSGRVRVRGSAPLVSVSGPGGSGGARALLGVGL